MSSIQDTEFMDTIRAMIAQQGETWADTTLSYSGKQMDRSVELNAVVIAFSPNSCYRLTLTPESQSDWIIKEDILQPEEIGKFYAAFGFHWQLVIGALIPVGTSQGDHLMRVRAFIANGRKAGQEWSISLGEVESKSVDMELGIG